MFDLRHYPHALAVSQAAALSQDDYDRLYRQSVEDPDTFWTAQAQRLTWMKPWSQVQRSDLRTGQARWFDGSQLNVSYNCIDRHLATRAEQTALLWEGDDPSDTKAISYRELHRQVCRLANVLKSRGVAKGDRVCIYMPMIPEAAFAMLACARIGAVHSVVFGGFSPDALRDRILDADCRTVITADEGVRGGKRIALKQNVDKALASCPAVSTVVVVRRTGGDVAWDDGRDLWYHHAIEQVDETCPPEPMEAEAPLFILYTSGSTGKPKGVLHTTAGYLLQAAMTFDVVFDYRQGGSLLVHRRRRLGHRPQLHRVWPSGQWRHLADVRGRAQLPRQLAVLASGGQASGQHLLHRTHRPARPDARRACAPAKYLPCEPALAGQRG